MKNLFLVLCLIAFTLLNACSTHPSKPNAPNIHVTYAEDFRIRFSGKGAGAGMMLMGSMGPMGIAIGVAIDEGIAKDIRAALENSGVSIDAVLKEAALASWNKHCIDAHSSSALCDASESILIEVNSLAFVSKGDDVYPDYAITLLTRGNRYELSTSGLFEAESTPKALLNDIKRDGSASASLLVLYLEKSFENRFAN
jgi:hypothetical protein